jgi:putative ABC transport system permease protein
MFEDLIFALKNFKRNKTRTILSLLGVIIGVASVIVITSLGKSATENIKQSFGSAGLDQVRLNQGFMRRGRNSTPPITFNESFRNEIYAEIPHIKKVWFVNSLSVVLTREDLSQGASVSAVEYGYLEMCGIKADYGNFFSVSDDALGAQVVVLGNETAQSLFPDGGAEGQPLIMISNNVPFGVVVAGVLAKQNAGMESTERGVYIPRGFYEKKIQPSPAASMVVLQAESRDYADGITKAVQKYAEEKTGDSFAISVLSMQSILEQYGQVMGTMSLLLSGIAAISLLVGGIGIMNIMIVTVTERKKEIGIRKAIGASPGMIRMQFLVESAAITLCGGIIGIALGIALSAVVLKIIKWVFAINFQACVLAFLFSAFVGVFFGFNPASRAAKLDPVLALAQE